MADEFLVQFGDGADPDRPAGRAQSYARGGSPRWTPETIADIHAMAQLGRYQLRGFSTFQRNLPSFDDLVVQPATMTRLPLEGYRESCNTVTVLGAGQGKVEKPIELAIPIYIGSMSFGALSATAKAALGRGASAVGSMTCTGEGGMLEEEREASTTLVYQVTPSRYMLDLDHLRRADGLEIAMGQGAKPGTGGLLLGMKVSERVATMRSLPIGVDQRATCRHPDFMGADDLQIKIEELREATDYQVPILVKIGATRPYFDVAVAAKCGADVIVIDGMEGGTGASPEPPPRPHRRPHHLGHPGGPAGPGRHRHERQGRPSGFRRDPLRGGRRQEPGPGCRRGDDRHRQPHRARGATRLATSRTIEPWGPSRASATTATPAAAPSASPRRTRTWRPAWTGTPRPNGSPASSPP